MLSRLKEQLAIPNFYPIFGGLLIAQVFNLLNLFILPRFYTPKDFAIFGIFSSIVFILIEIVNLKFDMALQVAEVSKRKDLTLVSIFIALIFSFIVLILTLLYVLIGQNFYFLLLPIITLAYGINQSLVAWLNIQHQNNTITIYRVLIVLVNFSVAFVCIYFWKLHLGLIFGFVIAQLVAALFLMYLNKSIFDSLISLEKIKYHLQSFYQFPKFGVLSSLLNSIAQNGIIPIIIHLFGNTMGGYFTMSSKVLAAPKGLYHSALSQIFLQQASKLSKAELKQLSVKILFFGFLVGIIPSLFVLFFGQEIFNILFGAEWQIAGNIASYIVLWYFIGAIVNPVNLLLDIYQKLNIELYWNIVSLILKFSCLYVGFYFQNFWLAIALLSIVSILMNGILLVFSFRLLK